MVALPSDMLTIVSFMNESWLDFLWLDIFEIVFTQWLLITQFFPESKLSSTLLRNTFMKQAVDTEI